MHEAQLHEDNCFVTLTYDDEKLPAGGSLVPSHFVDFMKRLRWRFGEGIRFFHCGEYGAQLQRPHHHAVLFNLKFPDLQLHNSGRSHALYTSEELARLWGHGFCSVGEASFETAAYVARYTLKKFTGSPEEAAAWYGGRHPEYLTMSRRPGLGRGYVDKYRSEIYRADSCVVRGAECKPPRFYDGVQEKAAPSVMEKVRARRRAEAAKSAHNSPRRLLAREAVREGATSQLTRPLEG